MPEVYDPEVGQQHKENQEDLKGIQHAVLGPESNWRSA